MEAGALCLCEVCCTANVTGQVGGSVASKMHGGIARPPHSAADALGRSPVLSAIREHRRRLGP